MTLLKGRQNKSDKFLMTPYRMHINFQMDEAWIGHIACNSRVFVKCGFDLGRALTKWGHGNNLVTQ